MSIQRLLQGKGPKVATLGPQAKLREAIGILSRDDTSAIIVANDEGKILGLLSSSDLAVHLNNHVSIDRALPVEYFMTKRVVSVDIGASVQQVEELMLKHRIRHVPVTDKGKLCGIISALDIMAYRLRNAESEASQLRGYVAKAGNW